ncbi:inositol monophosphatase 1 [Lepeophtheirus salmonis]|uniref:Inositol-1-monophosphatase n=2 Tax=Lepeophtheirus salmonis TaxID=72036 RepID=C1BV64_LEPSM|nr:inositol monophosphatase 1-like [Lepeophtheirus salmonis]ACO12917.1 Inositol monophosphatase ttx-7 [Lepeophtheirus salmonis]
MSESDHEYEYESFLKVAILIAKKAGNLINNAISNPDKQFISKSGETDIVTETDKAVEDLIRRELFSLFPDHEFIGEESEFEKGLTMVEDKPTWIVDPIDGTLNFVHCNHLTAVSIGLAINKKIVLGVIYAPMRQDMYTAISGKGAFKNGIPIHVSKVHDLNRAIITYEIWARSKDEHKEHQLKNLSILCSNVMAIRSYGSACMNLCLMAEGQVDIYIDTGIRVWDMVAGALIVQEAGGVVRHTDGSEFDAMSRSILVTSSPNLIKEIVDLKLSEPKVKRDHTDKITL